MAVCRGSTPLELLVDFQDAAQLAVQLIGRQVADVEVDAEPVLLHAQSFAGADVEDLPGGDVAGDQVAVLGIAFFEEVVAFLLGNLLGRTRVMGPARDPDAAPFAARLPAHQPQFIGPGNRGGWTCMNSPLAYLAPA